MSISVKDYIKYNMNFCLRNCHDLTAEALARQHGYLEIAEILKSYKVMFLKGKFSFLYFTEHKFGLSIQ